MDDHGTLGRTADPQALREEGLGSGDSSGSLVPAPVRRTRVKHWERRAGAFCYKAKGGMEKVDWYSPRGRWCPVAYCKRCGAVGSDEEMRIFCARSRPSAGSIVFGVQRREIEHRWREEEKQLDGLCNVCARLRTCTRCGKEHDISFTRERWLTYVFSKAVWGSTWGRQLMLCLNCWVPLMRMQDAWTEADDVRRYVEQCKRQLREIYRAKAASDRATQNDERPAADPVHRIGWSGERGDRGEQSAPGVLCGPAPDRGSASGDQGTSGSVRGGDEHQA